MLFYVHAGIFGTTQKCENLPPLEPSQFKYTEDIRSVFLRYRIERVLPNTLNASPSITALAKDTETNTLAIIKTFYIPQSGAQPNVERLLYESQIYRFVTQYLAPVTRLVVPWYATYMYKPWSLDISKWNPSDLIAFREQMVASGNNDGFREFYNTFGKQKGVDVMFSQVTRRVLNDVTLLYNMQADEDVLQNVFKMKQILFQVVFMIACWTEMGVQHNDLHVNNVLLGYETDSSKMKTQGYLYKGTVFWLPKQYFFIRVFDWDLSYVQSIGPNPGLDAEKFAESGVGNVLNPRYDLYMFVSSLLQLYALKTKTPPVEVNAFLQAVRPRVYHKIETRLCNIDPVSQNCIPFPENQPADLLTAEQALLNPFFDEYRDRAPIVEGRTSEREILIGPSAVPSRGLLSRLLSGASKK